MANIRKKLLIITPGARPIFGKKPGAVELLIKEFILENEKQKLFDIEYIGIDKSLTNNKLCLSRNIFIPKRPLQKNVRGFLGLFFNNIRTSYEQSVLQTIKKRAAEYDYILLEGVPRMAIYLRPITKAKIITHIHSNTLHVIKNNQKIINKSTDCFVAVSDYIANKINSVLPNAKVVTAYNCQNQICPNKKQKEATRKELNLSTNDRVILFVGRMSEQKGLYELITAFNNLPHDDNRKLLIIANSKNSMGMINNLKQSIKHIARGSRHDSKLTSNLDLKYIRKINKLINSNKNILHIEYVPQSKLGLYYGISSILVVPSLYDEAFGNVIIEGAAHSLPIIATRVGGIPEILSDTTGILIEAKNAAAEIRNAIISLENDNQKAISLSNEAFKLSKHYTSKDYYSKITEALSRV